MLYIYITTILQQPDIPLIPGIAEGTVARFNYSDPAEREKAALYRLHEVPFILTDVPDVTQASKRWTVSGSVCVSE